MFNILQNHILYLVLLIKDNLEYIFINILIENF